MRREPDYLYLMIGLVSAVVLVTAVSPLDSLAILGVFIAVLSLLVTAYSVIERRSQLLLAILLPGLRRCHTIIAAGAFTESDRGGNRYHVRSDDDRPLRFNPNQQ